MIHWGELDFAGAMEKPPSSPRPYLDRIPSIHPVDKAMVYAMPPGYTAIFSSTPVASNTLAVDPVKSSSPDHDDQRRCFRHRRCSPTRRRHPSMQCTADAAPDTTLRPPDALVPSPMSPPAYGWGDRPSFPDTSSELRRREFFSQLSQPGSRVDPAEIQDSFGPSPSPSHRFASFDRQTRDADDPIEVREIDLQFRENTQAHNTTEFEIAQRAQAAHLVLRRGQTFTFTINFGDDYKPNRDELKVVFEIGDYPRESRGTRLILPVVNEAPPAETPRSQWWAQLISSTDRKAEVKVHIGFNAIVGCWNLKIVSSIASKKKAKMDLITLAKHDPAVIEYVYPIYGVYILFNPWCEDDPTFMPDEAERREYVCSDVGKIWRGSFNSRKPSPWVFGQFEHLVLEASMLLLEKSTLPLPLRASPAHVARIVASMVNAPDEKAVVEGNWTGEYRNGPTPTDWTGSTDILRHWAAGGRGVPYGQCWVFAGIVTTVLRGLGIPCRPVTVYSAAQDSDSSVTVDIHVDPEGRLFKDVNRDSIWNFHVWNECWMKRADLPKGYGGWQALDGTPQEKREGIYNAGPASLEAIRKGEVGLGFETSLFVGSVNADKCYWLHSGNNIRYIMKDTHIVGRMICTKKPGPNQKANEDMLDLTKTYKPSEGSKEDRVALLRTVFTDGSHSAMAYRQDNAAKASDVTFKLDLRRDIVIGQDFHVNLQAVNTSSEARTVSLSVRIDSMLYFGTNSRKIKHEHSIIMLSPGQSTSAKVLVSVREYLHKLLDQSAFMVTVLANVKETGQIFVASDDFRVQMPDVSMKYAGKAIVGEPISVELELVNPIPVQLANPKFIIEGPGLTEPNEVVCRSVMPHGTVRNFVELKPWKSGPRTLIVRFTSSQLQDIDGQITIDVKPQPT